KETVSNSFSPAVSPFNLLTIQRHTHSFSAPLGPWHFSHQVRGLLQNAIRHSRQCAINADRRWVERLSYGLFPIPPAAFHQLSLVADNAHLRTSSFFRADRFPDLELLHVSNLALVGCHRNRGSNKRDFPRLYRPIYVLVVRLDNSDS